LCRQLPYIQWLVTALTALAWVRQARGDQAGALAAMDEAGQVAPSPDVAADRVFAAGVQCARLDLAQGRTADAARWTAQRGLAANDQASYLREQEQLVLARVLAASGEADQALGLAERLHALAADQGRVTGMIEARALQALALAAVEDEDGALAALTDGLVLAARCGYVQGFVDQGRPLAILVAKLAAMPGAAAQVPRPFLERLVGAFSRSGLTVPARPRARRDHRGRPGGAADRPGAGGAGTAGRGPVQPGHRRGAGDHPGHRETACHPHPGEARRGQPHPGGRQGPGSSSCCRRHRSRPPKIPPASSPWRASCSAPPCRSSPATC
jgi:MalT-like TPR region